MLIRTVLVPDTAPTASPDTLTTSSTRRRECERSGGASAHIPALPALSWPCRCRAVDAYGSPGRVLGNEPRLGPLPLDGRALARLTHLLRLDQLPLSRFPSLYRHVGFRPLEKMLKG